MPKSAEKHNPTTERRKPEFKRRTIQPVASRPVMPADYGVSKSRKGLLDWSWARERVAKSHNYVIVTVRPDGRPHAMGMHGLWFEDRFYFGTGETTRKARNLAVNPHCILVNERLDELIIVEGTAEPISYDAVPPGVSAASKEKYGWPYDRRMGGVIFKVTPCLVFAFPEKLFATAPTRWIFRGTRAVKKTGQRRRRPESLAVMNSLRL